MQEQWSNDCDNLWQKEVIKHHINDNVVAGIRLIYRKTGVLLSEAKQISDELIRILVDMKLISEGKLLTHFFAFKPNKFSDKQQLILKALKQTAEAFKKETDKENALNSFTQKLKEYAKEIGILDLDLSLDDLIDSHRRLRSINQQNNQQWLKEIEKARERAYNDARDYALKHDFISRDALKKMTMQELSNLLCEDDCCD